MSHLRSWPLLDREVFIWLAAGFFFFLGPFPEYAAAQEGQAGTRSAPPTSRRNAPEDISGNWVAVVTEDYRWRVVVPPKGDYTSIPLNPNGKLAAAAWDPDQDRRNGQECKAYGPGNLMRIVGRLKIRWQGDETLVLETDKGQQRREIHFNDGAMPGDRSLQGFSKGEVVKTTTSRGFFPNNYYTHIAAVTTGHTGGYLRLNGVPYSEDAVISEHFSLSEGYGGQWLTVMTVVDDPKFLTTKFVTSSDFRREADDSLWKPEPCVSQWGPVREVKE